MRNLVIAGLVIAALLVGIIGLRRNNGDVSVPHTHMVDIQRMTFSPDSLVVSTGDTIVFTNNDVVPHDVTEKNKRWASPILYPGDTWAMTVKTSASYYCSLHLVMTGQIITR